MRHRVAVAGLTTLVLAAAPALAWAQAPTVTSPTPAPAPPTTVPKTAKLVITPERVGGTPARALAGARWRVRGVLTPYVAGQKVSVRLYRGARKVAVKQVTVQPRSTGKTGFFLVSFRIKQPGRIKVRATHRATPELATTIAQARTVDILPLSAHQGQRGEAVRLLQQQLDRLGYVVGQRGYFDDRTARAVMAFRKVTGMARTFVADREVFRRLARGQGAFRVRFPKHGRHVEADISRQVLALIGPGGKVLRIYHISSGAPGTPTILGTFRVYSQAYGTNAKGMVHSSFFIRGYAIHGFASVPPYNASHGCLRVPIPDSLSIRNWLRIGTIVDTYA